MSISEEEEERLERTHIIELKELYKKKNKKKLGELEKREKNRRTGSRKEEENWKSKRTGELEVEDDGFCFWSQILKVGAASSDCLMLIAASITSDK